MNLFIKLGLASMFILIQSCDSTKTATENEATQVEETKNMEQDLMSQGYSKGLLTAQLKSNCTYILIEDKHGAKFDPINLEEGTFGSFDQANKMVVYFKYRALRRPNRCLEAQPITILDIKME